MNDTNKRIEEYRKQLPGLKERVLAFALLLAISITITVTSTFAWVVLSRSPEVSGMVTTIAANGNLEIALANGTGFNPPKVSGEGDSSEANGQTIGAANVTWGNLINLADDSYGLDHLILRPARLNEDADLTKNPLYTAVYTADGRYSGTNDQFAYTQWNPAKKAFTLTDGYGVRAISSTTWTTDNEESGQKLVAFEAKKNEAKSKVTIVGDQYEALTNPKKETDSEYGKKIASMESLAYLMGVHMTAQLNSEEKYTKAQVESMHVQNMIFLCGEFLKVYQAEAEAMAAILNLQLFLEGKADAYDADRLMNEDLESDPLIKRVFAYGDSGNSYTEFKADYELIRDIRNQLELINEKGNTCLQWKADISAYKADGLTKNLYSIVNSLVNVNICMIRVRNGSDSLITIQELLSSASGMGALSLNSKYNGKSCDAVITNGVFYNLAGRIGRNLSEVGAESNSGKGLAATAKVYVSTMNLGEQSATLYAVISTNATGSVLPKIVNGIEYNDASVNKIVTADDTYGMAIDFWVRTNAAASYLILEGNVLTKTVTVQSTTTDKDGNKVDLYVLTRTIQMDGTTLTDEYDLYTTDEGKTWYKAVSHEKFELQTGDEPMPVMEEEEIVIGYEGDNRVWDEYDPNEDNIGLNVNRTTQGSGSCYVFYFSTPEERDRSLHLLKALTVVFMDTKTGNVLATAHLDTEHPYEEGGKVTVPLALDRDSLVAAYDSNGNPIYGITLLDQNAPQMITTLVYLDGTAVTNSDVLSDSNIRGKLNIQFGSSVELHPIDNEVLKNEEIKVSAEITGGKEFDFDAANPPSTSVKVYVNALGTDSYEAKTVTAYFTRMLNKTQGIREETAVTFEKNADGDWVANYTFTAPGRYIIRSVWVNGMEYDIDTGSDGVFPEVIVNGFEYGNISYDIGTDVLTGDTTYKGSVSLKISVGNASQLPKNVQGRFVSEDRLTTVTVYFNDDDNDQVWTGSAIFRKSGEYAFEYLVIDNEYYYIEDEKKFRTNISLGVKVSVFTNSPLTFKYLANETEATKKNLAMTVHIMNDVGEEIRGLTDVDLFYKRDGSEKGLYTGLTWNGNSYSGILNPDSAGRFVFGYVSIGKEDYITRADNSPVFTLISPNPPEFVSAEAPGVDGYLYAPNKDAKFDVVMAYAGGTDLLATIRNTFTGTEYTVKGKDGDEATESPDYEDYPDNSLFHYYFEIPVDQETGYAGQDGVWELVSITSIGGFDENGVEYTTDNPWKHDLQESISAKVVSTLKIEFQNGNTTTLSGHSFMEAYTVPAGTLKVTIKDFAGVPIKDEVGVSVSMKFTYVNGTSAAKGGYTSDSLDDKTTGAVVTVDFTTTKGSGIYTQSGDISFLYAGDYKTELTITIADEDPKTYYSTDATPLQNMPVFTVWTEKPTVKITARSNYGSSSNTDTSAIVYFGSSSSTCGTNYSQPYVSITLDDKGEATSAYLQFAASSGGTVHLYTSNGGSTATDKYEWTANGACQRWVGYYKSKTASTDDKTAAGKLTAGTLVLVYNNVNYTVDIADITIDNPS